MADLFSSPLLADLLLAVLLLEALVIAGLKGRSAIARVGPFLLAGAALMLALRAVLAGAAWPWVAVGLAGSFLAHLWDLGTRGT